jgi:hypothetical protein
MRPARQKKGPGESFIVTSLDGPKRGITLRALLWGATVVVAIAFVIVVRMLTMQLHPASATPPQTATPLTTTVPGGTIVSQP